MQQQKPFTDSHSYIVKQTKIATSKSRRRFLGSIFFLIIAFIILFKATTLTKPLKVNPSTIKIETTTTKPEVYTSKIAESIIPIEKSIEPKQKNNIKISKNIFKTSIVNKQKDGILTPDDILNDRAKTKIDVFYIQIITNSVPNISIFKKYAKDNNLTIKINNINNNLLQIIIGEFLDKKDAINEEKKLNNKFLDGVSNAHIK